PAHAKANSAQRNALYPLAKKQCGELVPNVLAVEAAPIALTLPECKDSGCALLTAGTAKVETRCLDHHDKVCGNESAYYPPLTKSVQVRPAMAVEHSFVGKGFNATWKDTERRGAYLGSFEVR